MKPAAFLLVAACASAPLEVHREGESPQKHQTAAADQRGTQDAPLVIKLDSAQRKADSANSQHQGEEVAKAADKLNDYPPSRSLPAILDRSTHTPLRSGRTGQSERRLGTKRSH